MAVTYDATNIYVDDDAGSVSGSGYTFAEIVAAVTAAEAIRIDAGAGAGFPTYRFLKHIVLGSTAAGATTNASHIVDSACVVTFDNNKRITCRGTTTTNIGFSLGTKVGTGSTSSGKNGVDIYTRTTAGAVVSLYRGIFTFYGCKLKNEHASGTSSALQFIPAASTGCELINCIIDGFTGHVFGASGGTPIETVYNVDITSVGTTSAITAQSIATAERITIATTTNISFTQTSSPGVVYKDVAFFGAPPAHLRWSGATATNWTIVRPVWIDGIARFSGGGPQTADTGAHEYWLYDVKVVDGTGAGIANIPVKLTDAQGNVQVNTTTDSTGKITFGSGLTANAVIVMDHYAVGTTYTQRHRSPFLCEVNTGAGANANYNSRRYYFNWPGYSTITTSAGQFEDVVDIVNLQEPSGGQTSWVEKEMP